MKVKDPRYDYYITVAAQIIIRNKKGEVLLAKRPDTWEWAPGRWSLIGGKLYVHESLEDAIKRKTKQELGIEIIPEGLYEIKHLVIEGKSAYMYFFTSEHSGIEGSGEMTEYRWFNMDMIKKFDNDKFAEFFYKEMLLKYLTEISNVLPVSKIQSLDYIKLTKTANYKKWFKGVINKDYDPEAIPDFLKWKKTRH